MALLSGAPSACMVLDEIGWPWEDLPSSAPPEPACPRPVCGGVCCPEGVVCEGGVCMLPDLRVNVEAAAKSLWVTSKEFAENSCELEEQCVSGGGMRRLLQFESRIENWGSVDLNAGPAAGNPLFEYSACHGHYHFLDFTDYRLLYLDGSLAAMGHKQSFCLYGMERVSDDPAVAPPGTRPEPTSTHCNVLPAGWADVYGVGLSCQWVDVTDVPAGDYLLQVTVNPLAKLPETTTSNNTIRVPVRLGPNTSACSPQPELCGDAFDQDCDQSPDIWDEDCLLPCVLTTGDLRCDEPIEVSGNDSCERAHPLAAQGSYTSVIGEPSPGTLAPSCGGAGGEAFYRLSLPSPRIVYLGALASSVDTVLALYREGCAGSELRCEDDACGGVQGHFAQLLEAGNYLIVLKAKDAGATGRVTLRFQSANPGTAVVLDGPGVYGGNTRKSGDSVDACDRRPGFARDDVYAFAACGPELSVSTCGAAGFDARLGLHVGSLLGASQACSADAQDNGCAPGQRGAALRTSVKSGLTFVVVEGTSAREAGRYQMQLSF